MSKHPLETIADIYKDQVSKIDEKGYSDDFRKCTELFFKSVNNEYCTKDNPVHFSDIKYLDGYFIFGHGTNSVIHFYIDECPGWKFGIWWGSPDDKGNYPGQFFCQYEDTIDKFKPSASTIHEYIYASPSKGYCSSFYAVMDINFIINEPYLAFCRDYNYFDYNHEFHTREECKAIYDKYVEEKKNEEYYTNLYDEKILQFIKDNVLTEFNGSELSDHGPGSYPRYTVVAPYSSNTDIFTEPGRYAWFPNEDEYGKQVMKDLKDLEKEANRYADEYGFCYHRPVMEDIVFVIDK